MGKIAVISRVGPGFIGNRLVDAMTRQAVQLVMEGATPSAVDAALEKFGMRMGPFRVFDLVGNDIPALTREAHQQAGDPDWQVADELVARGWLGHKTARGWYRYDERLRASVDPEVTELIASIQAARGIVPRSDIPADEIVDRCILALVNEGAAVLAEGIALRASDIDVVYLNGYGFPPSRGGPMFYADTVGLFNVVRRMRYFARTVPFGAAFWQPHPLIIDLTETSRSLSAWSETL
jgi:3-hydroxyacyl-CoA dehydrogenase